MPYQARRSSPIETLHCTSARARRPRVLRALFSACAVATALLGCGGGGSSGGDSGTGTPTPPTTVAPNWPLPVPSGVASLSLLAGNIGGVGNLDGQGTDARFSAPQGVALDKASGNLYVTDTGNFTVRKIAPGGVVSTLAGQPGVTGYADGAGNAARFTAPTGVAVDSAGQVYVADGKVLRRVSPAGVVTTLAGSATQSGYVDASGASARFGSITALAIDAQDNLWVADLQGTPGGLTGCTDTVIRKLSPAGVVSTVAGQPGLACTDGVDGPAASAVFAAVGGLAVDGTGSVYVLNNNGRTSVFGTAGRNTVRKISPAGVVSTLALSFPGSTEADTLTVPAGLALDPSGALLVATREWCGYQTPSSFICRGNNAVLRIAGDGTVSQLAGAGPHGAVDGVGDSARFFLPAALAVDAAGTVFVADTGNHAVRKLAAGGNVSTYAGAAGSVFYSPFVTPPADGKGAAAIFTQPKDIAVDAAGNALVSDYRANRQVSPQGQVTDAPFFRRGYSSGLSGSGTDAYAGLAFDREESLYQWDNYLAGNQSKGSLFRTTVAGSVSTVLTTPIDASKGVTDVTVTPDGVAYITDALNGVRKVQRDGSVSILTKTVLGHLIVDGSGNVFGNTGDVLLKISTAGEVSVLAGSSADAGFADGVGASARFNTPAGLALDGAGNLFVADSGNHAIRRITPAGVVTTVLGDPARQGIRAGVGAAASLNRPLGLAFSPQGPLLVTTDTAVMKLTWP